MFLRPQQNQNQTERRRATIRYDVHQLNLLSLVT